MTRSRGRDRPGFRSIRSSAADFVSADWRLILHVNTIY